MAPIRTGVEEAKAQPQIHQRGDMAQGMVRTRRLDHRQTRGAIVAQVGLGQGQRDLRADHLG